MNRPNNGFTLVELLITIGIFAMFVAVSVPIGYRYFRYQSISQSRDNLISVLRYARDSSITQKNSEMFGVKFFPTSFVLFEGTSYVLRNSSEDEIYSLSADILISGMDEIVFSSLTGIPSTTGVITFSNGNDLFFANVLSSGSITKN